MFHLCNLQTDNSSIDLISQILNNHYQIFLLINSKPFLFDGLLKSVPISVITASDTQNNANQSSKGRNPSREQVENIVKFVHKNMDRFEPPQKKDDNLYYYTNSNSLSLLMKSEYCEHFLKIKCTSNEITHENNDTPDINHENSNQEEPEKKNKRLAIRPSFSMGGDYTKISFLQYTNSTGGAITSRLNYHGHLGLDFRAVNSSFVMNLKMYLPG